MIIIAFSCKTSKIMPRIFCRKYKHVAPIAVYKDTMILYQFVKYNTIVQINLRMQDITKLQMFGWRFIYLTGNLSNKFYPGNAKTCVQMTKQAIGIKNWKIQTPDALYKFLQQIKNPN